MWRIAICGQSCIQRNPYSRNIVVLQHGVLIINVTLYPLIRIGVYLDEEDKLVRKRTVTINTKVDNGLRTRQVLVTRELISDDEISFKLQEIHHDHLGHHNSIQYLYEEVCMIL